MLDISTVGIVSMPKRSAIETPRRELSEDVPFGIGTLLVVEQSSLENPPQGCVIYTVVHEQSNSNLNIWYGFYVCHQMRRALVGVVHFSRSISD